MKFIFLRFYIWNLNQILINGFIYHSISHLPYTIFQKLPKKSYFIFQKIGQNPGFDNTVQRYRDLRETYLPWPISHQREEYNKWAQKEREILLWKKYFDSTKVKTKKNRKKSADNNESKSLNKSLSNCINISLQLPDNVHLKQEKGLYEDIQKFIFKYLTSNLTNYKSTKKLKKQTENNFPSEIILKSLSKWLPDGNSGYFKNNGCVSIWYENKDKNVENNLSKCKIKVLIDSFPKSSSALTQIPKTESKNTFIKVNDNYFNSNEKRIGKKVLKSCHRFPSRDPQHHIIKTKNVPRKFIHKNIKVSDDEIVDLLTKIQAYIKIFEITTDKITKYKKTNKLTKQTSGSHQSKKEFDLNFLIPRKKRSRISNVKKIVVSHIQEPKIRTSPKYFPEKSKEMFIKFHDSSTQKCFDDDLDENDEEPHNYDSESVSNNDDYKSLIEIQKSNKLKAKCGPEAINEYEGDDTTPSVNKETDLSTFSQITSTIASTSKSSQTVSSVTSVVMSPSNAKTLSISYRTKFHPTTSKQISHRTKLQSTIINKMSYGTKVQSTINNKSLSTKTSVKSSNQSKSNCEILYKVKCVCSIFKLVNLVNKEILEIKDEKLLLRTLADLECPEYIPLTSSYKISTEMKPKLISNKRKELLVDDDFGPKEILQDTLQDLLHRGIPNEGVDFYVFPSTNIEIPCFTKDDMHLSPNSADSAKYVWTHGNQKSITEGRITEDFNHRGTLAIDGVTMADSDNYTCIANFINPDTQEPTSYSFLHKVMVVSVPKIALHSLIHYNAEMKCDQEILEMFELYLPQQIEELICKTEENKKHICDIEIYNPICHTKNIQNERRSVKLKSLWLLNTKNNDNSYKKREEVAETIEISMNYEVNVGHIWEFVTAADNRSQCSPFCKQKIILKIIEILLESMQSGLVYPVASAEGVMFVPDEMAMSIKILIACEGGLRLSEGFCVACPKGHYSEEGSTKCKKCPKGTFQDNIASKSCVPCPHPLREGCYDLWFASSTYLAVVGGFFCLVILTICCYCIFRRKPGKGYKKLNPEKNEIKPKVTKVSRKKRSKDRNKNSKTPTAPGKGRNKSKSIIQPSSESGSKRACIPPPPPLSEDF